jgi:hypothetical protein
MECLARFYQEMIESGLEIAGNDFRGRICVAIPNRRIIQIKDVEKGYLL